jgi:predicted dehydrogenase
MNLTRRQALRLSAMAASVSRLAPAQEGRRIGYCMVGLGRISMQHFMPATKTSRLAKVTALVSGHRDKADQQAALYGVPAKSIYNYQNFDSIADNNDIDAVYIALPNSMHAEYTIRAAKAGKHVLCEKPMATSVKDSQAMIDACRKANRKLMIAYRCQFEPVNLRAVELIRGGKLGKIESIDTVNGFNIAPNEWRCNKALAGGGPLMDVGIYSLNACRYLTGEEPVELKGAASVIDKDGRFKEVEENLVWTMKFPSGAVASCNTTYGANMSGGMFRVYGSRGVIFADAAFAYDGLKLSARVEGEAPIEFAANERDPAHFVREADHFSECILKNTEPKCNGEEGLKDMKYMTEIYRSAGRA